MTRPAKAKARRRHLPLTLPLALAVLPTLAGAQSREAVVVAGADGPQPAAATREAALDVSELLSGLGYVVIRLEAPTADRLEAALARLTASDGISIFYHAGPMDATGPEPAIATPDGPRGISTLLSGSQPRPDGGGEMLSFLDGCLGPTAAGPVAAPEDDAPAGLPETGADDALPGVFLALSGGPGQPCPAPGGDGLTDLILARLGAPGVELDTVFAGVGPVDDATGVDGTVPLPPVRVVSGLSGPVVLRPADPGLRLTSADYAMLDGLDPELRAQMIAMWIEAGIPVDLTRDAAAEADPVLPRAGTIVATSPVRPVASAVAVSPIRAALPAGGSTPVQLVAQPAPATGLTRPAPGTNGLPEPSIIVGFPAPPDAPEIGLADPDTEPSAVSGAELDFTDLDARRALRESDEDLFISLVNSGAFDPPEGTLALAIQTELRRMNCYTGALDGDFGPGSRRGLNAYYEQIGLTAPSQDPTLEIYRQLLLRDDVTCPVAVAAPATSTGGGQQTATQRPAQQQQPAQQAAPAPATPDPAPQRGFTQNSLQTGTFR
ncbi:MAG: hypothetical protein JJT81_03745 [Rubellimicrobium sp.]|nr:hypothetical protein [Rubellimicrobium sp.]